MMIVFWSVVLVAALLCGRRYEKRRLRLLYPSAPRVVGREAVFSCGCSFDLDLPSERVLCAAHRALIDAEVAA